MTADKKIETLAMALLQSVYYSHETAAQSHVMMRRCLLCRSVCQAGWITDTHNDGCPVLLAREVLNATLASAPSPVPPPAGGQAGRGGTV